MLDKIRKGEKGFTLIELLVVIGILAVLAAVTSLYLVDFIGAGKDEAKETELSIVMTAASMALLGGDGEMEEHGLVENPEIIKPNPKAAPNTVNRYLVRETVYKYHITILGVVTQHETSE